MSEPVKILVIIYLCFLALRFISWVWDKIVRLVGWLFVNGYWFPKTARQLRKEAIVECSEVNTKLDLYIEEMEKSSNGVFANVGKQNTY